MIILILVVYFLFTSLNLIRYQAPHPSGVARAMGCNVPRRPEPSPRALQSRRFQSWPPSREWDDQPHRGRRRRRLTPCSLLRDQAYRHSVLRPGKLHPAEPFPAVHRSSSAQSMCSGPSCFSWISRICCNWRTTCACRPWPPRQQQDAATPGVGDRRLAGLAAVGPDGSQAENLCWLEGCSGLRRGVRSPAPRREDQPAVLSGADLQLIALAVSRAALGLSWLPARPPDRQQPGNQATPQPVLPAEAAAERGCEPPGWG